MDTTQNLHRHECGNIDLSFDINYFFDFLKTIAITGVYSFHVLGWSLGRAETTPSEVISYGVLKYFLSNAQSLTDYILGILRTISSFGDAGVELFIIASGFGLYFSYLSKRTDWLSFYEKRALRIIPLYYLFLIASFLTYAYLLHYSNYSSPQGLKILRDHFLLIQTFTESYRLYGLFYFVAIVSHLYLIFPLLTRMMQSEKWRLSFWGFTCLLPFILSEIVKLLHVDFKGVLFTDYLLYFFLGMLIANSVFHKKKLHRILLAPRLSFLSLILLITLILIISYLYDYNDGFKILIKLCIFLSISFLFNVVSRLPLKALIGLVSYSSFVVYLSHLLFVRLIYNILIPKIGWIGLYDYKTYVYSVFFPVIVFVAFLTQKTYDMLLNRFSLPRRISN